MIVDAITIKVTCPDNADDADIEAQFGPCEKLREFLQNQMTAYLNSNPFPAGWKGEVDNE